MSEYGARQPWELRGFCAARRLLGRLAFDDDEDGTCHFAAVARATRAACLLQPSVCARLLHACCTPARQPFALLHHSRVPRSPAAAGRAADAAALPRAAAAPPLSRAPPAGRQRWRRRCGRRRWRGTQRSCSRSTQQRCGRWAGRPRSRSRRCTCAPRRRAARRWRWPRRGASGGCVRASVGALCTRFPPRSRAALPALAERGAAAAAASEEGEPLEWLNALLARRARRRRWLRRLASLPLPSLSPSAHASTPHAACGRALWRRCCAAWRCRV